MLHIIGKSVRTHGIHGDLIVQLNVFSKKALKKNASLFFETRPDLFLPYTIGQIRLLNDTTYLLQLLDKKNKESADELVNKNIAVDETTYQLLSSLKDDHKKSCVGFQVFNQEVLLGIIEEEIISAQQPLIKIVYENKDILLPFHKNFIVKKDTKNKIIVLDLPDGILDFYKN